MKIKLIKCGYWKLKEKDIRWIHCFKTFTNITPVQINWPFLKFWCNTYSKAPKWWEMFKQLDIIKVVQILHD